MFGRITSYLINEYVESQFLEKHLFIYYLCAAGSILHMHAGEQLCIWQTYKSVSYNINIIAHVGLTLVRELQSSIVDHWWLEGKEYLVKN